MAVAKTESPQPACPLCKSHRWHTSLSLTVRLAARASTQTDVAGLPAGWFCVSRDWEELHKHRIRSFTPCNKRHCYNYNWTPWPETASELYRPSDRRLSAKLVPTFSDRGCHVVSVADHYCRILVSLDRSRYFFFWVAPQLYSRGWVDPVADSLLLRKSGTAENRTQTSGSVARIPWKL
jgi:hypothetical protein